MARKPAAITKSKTLDLKESCFRAAREVIAERGVEGLSMRDVARKLKVSHQAPYRHFESRDHLLAEVMRQCFAEFARHLDTRKGSRDPTRDLAAMGLSYLDFAAKKPLEYRLMFGTPWPEPARYPDLVRNATHAFDILRDALRRKHGEGPDARARVDLDALFIWSTLHGLASITQANVMEHLQISAEVMSRFTEYSMQKMGVALVAAPQPRERSRKSPS